MGNSFSETGGRPAATSEAGRQASGDDGGVTLACGNVTTKSVTCIQSQ